MDEDEDYDCTLWDWEIEEMERNEEEGERNARCEQIRADALGITLEEFHAQEVAEYQTERELVLADAMWDIGLIKLYRKHMDLYVIGG